MDPVTSALSAPQLYLALGVVLAVAGMVRMLLVTDRVARLVAMNVMGTGSLLVLLSLAARSAALDPVLAALVITGLVVTVAFTGVGAVLIHRIEAAGDTPAETTADTPAHSPTDPPASASADGPADGPESPGPDDEWPGERP